MVALNKIDLVQDGGAPAIAELRDGFDQPEDVVAISAARGTGLQALLAGVEALLESEQHFVEVTLSVPYGRTDLVDRFHRLGRVVDSAFDERGTTLHGHLPGSMVGGFAPYIAVHSKAIAESEPAAVAVPHSAA